MSKARQLAKEGKRLGKLADELEGWEAVRLHGESADKHFQAAQMYMKRAIYALVALGIVQVLYLSYVILHMLIH